MCDFVEGIFEIQDIKQEYRRHMDRNKYITPEKGVEYLEKGEKLHREGKNELAKGWLKKALFVFQYHKDKERFIEVLNRMADVLWDMGLSSQSRELLNSALEYKNMEQDEFERECESDVFNNYVERPTHFNTQGSALICDLLKDLQRAA